MQPEDIINAIRAAHRERCFAMEQRKRTDLALGSFLRTQLGWRRDLPEKDRKVIADRAAAFADGGEDAALVHWKPVVAAAIAAREPFNAIEAAATKEMAKLARQLPVWEGFGDAVRGFGEVSLAVIVGEAGDLSIYKNPGKLWKRMGLAVMGDVRQGGLKKGASKEAWIEHGYSPMRRSRVWNIGDALIKGNRDGAYRTVYLERKEYEIARAPEMTPMHAHRRAQRYMEKRLLRHLWQAWRRTRIHAEPKARLSAADFDREANSAARPSLAQPPARDRAIEIAQPRTDAPGPATPLQQAHERSQPMVRAPAARRRTIPDAKPKKLSSVAASSSTEANVGSKPNTVTPQPHRAETTARAKPTIIASRPGTPIQQATVLAKPNQRVPAARDRTTAFAKPNAVPSDPASSSTGANADAKPRSSMPRSRRAETIVVSKPSRPMSRPGTYTNGRDPHG